LEERERSGPGRMLGLTGSYPLEGAYDTDKS
jgi:hypothetical protein